MTENFIPSLEAYHLQDEVTELQYLRRRVKELEKELSKLSWKNYADRMGGSFDQDEIDNANTWR